MSNAETIAKALSDNPQKVRDGVWLTDCPVHGHKHNLIVSDRDDGTIGVNCRAGCSQESVIVEIKCRGLWPSDTRRRIDPVGEVEPPKAHPTLGRPDHTYRYCQQLVVFRWDATRGRRKEIRPCTWNGTRWIWKAPPRPVPLYRIDLAQQRAEAVIVITEGEKAALAAQELLPDHVVTCWPGGSDNVMYFDTRALKGRRVVLWPDNDDPGVRCMTKAAARIAGAGAAQVRIMRPIGKPKDDAADFQGTSAEAATLVEIAPPFVLEHEVDDGKVDPEALEGTDLRNAERLIKRHGEDLKFSYQLGRWFVFDGKRWADDLGDLIGQRAQDTAKSIFGEECAKCDDPDRRARLAKVAMRAANRSGIDNMVTMARPVLSAKLEEFDCDHMAFNVPNGTVDLRKGHVRAHSRADKLTKLSHVVFDSATECPRWLSFLDEVMDGDQDLVRWLQKAVGYSLTGETKEQCFFMLYGTGRNGKTTFLEALKQIYGEYGTTADPQTFFASRRNDGHGPREDLVALRGARFVSAIEADSGQRFAESLLKALTGDDTIACEPKYGRQIQFKPTFKLWLGCNHRPTIRGQDLGIWRRIHLVPFNVQIPEEKVDADLAQKLRAEASGILAWALQGCLAWQSEGLHPVPDKIRAATDEYRRENDILGGFLDECTVQESFAKVQSRALYDAYKGWSKRNNEEPMSETAFSRRLIERGYKKHKTMTSNLWEGIGLPASGNQHDMEGYGGFSINSSREKIHGTLPGTLHNPPCSSEINVPQNAESARDEDILSGYDPRFERFEKPNVSAENDGTPQ